MRTVLSLLVVALSVLEVSAQTLAPKTSFSVDAKEVASKKSIGRNWETDYGSYDRDFARSRKLAIEVRNLSRFDPGEFKIHVYWVARTLATKEPFIHDYGVIDGKPGASTQYEHASKPLTSNVRNYASLGERYVKGAKIDGWMVILTRGEEVLASKASTGAYAQLLADPAKRDALFKTMEDKGLQRAPFRWN